MIKSFLFSIVLLASLSGCATINIFSITGDLVAKTYGDVIAPNSSFLLLSQTKSISEQRVLDPLIQNLVSDGHYVFGVDGQEYGVKPDNGDKAYAIELILNKGQSKKYESTSCSSIPDYATGGQMSNCSSGGYTSHPISLSVTVSELLEIKPLNSKRVWSLFISTSLTEVLFSNSEFSTERAEELAAIIYSYMGKDASKRGILKPLKD